MWFFISSFLQLYKSYIVTCHMKIAKEINKSGNNHRLFAHNSLSLSLSLSPLSLSLSLSLSLNYDLSSVRKNILMFECINNSDIPKRTKPFPIVRPTVLVFSPQKTS